MDAGVKIKKPVSGIAMGLIKNPGEEKYAVLSDILGDEDHLGDCLLYTSIQVVKVVRPVNECLVTNYFAVVVDKDIAHDGIDVYKRQVRMPLTGKAAICLWRMTFPAA